MDSILERLGGRIRLMTAAVIVAILLPTIPSVAGAQDQQEEDEQLALLRIEHTADQATALSPGQDVRFTVTVANQGDMAVNSTVEIDFDESIFELAGLTDNGLTTDNGVLLWAIESLEANDQLSLDYEVTAASVFPAQSTVVSHTATVMIGNERGQAATASIPLAAPVGPSGFSERRQITALEPAHVIIIMGMLLLVAASTGLVVVRASKEMFPRNSEATEVLKVWSNVSSNILTSVAVLVIATAVIILAIRGTIGEDGAVSILAGIAGYVLGRSSS